LYYTASGIITPIGGRSCTQTERGLNQSSEPVLSQPVHKDGHQ